MLAVCGLSTAEAKGPAVPSAPLCWACDLLLESKLCFGLDLTAFRADYQQLQKVIFFSSCPLLLNQSFMSQGSPQEEHIPPDDIERFNFFF